MFQPELQDRNDRHGRNDLLTTYIHWQAHLPHPDLRSGDYPKIHFTTDIFITARDKRQARAIYSSRTLSFPKQLKNK